MTKSVPTDFRTRNHYDWKILLEQIFPFGIPTRAQWNEPADMRRILHHISSEQSVNQIIFPNGTSLELSTVTPGPEPDQLCLNCGPDSPHFVKPSVLHFESFGEKENHEWSYFRLEAQPLEPIAGETTERAEELVELSPGNYVPYVPSRKKLPPKARLASRVLSGSTVIFLRNSSYIYSSAPFRAKHMEYDVEEFRRHIDELRHSFNRNLKAPTY